MFQKHTPVTIKYFQLLFNIELTIQTANTPL